MKRLTFWTWASARTRTPRRTLHLLLRRPPRPPSSMKEARRRVTGAEERRRGRAYESNATASAWGGGANRRHPSDRSTARSVPSSHPGICRRRGWNIASVCSGSPQQVWYPMFTTLSSKISHFVQTCWALCEFLFRTSPAGPLRLRRGCWRCGRWWGRGRWGSSIRRTFSGLQGEILMQP